MEPVELMVDDLTRRIAMLSLEASEWKARALLAEKALEELSEEDEEEVG